MVEPSFMLLFSVRLAARFEGFDGLPSGVSSSPPDQAGAYTSQFAEFETRLLGGTFVHARRLERWPLGRIAFDDLGDGAPPYADLYLLTHKSGMALWEVWLPAPSQSFDATRWVEWLNPEAPDGLVARLWRVLGVVNRTIAGESTWAGLYFPLTLLRSPQQPLEMVVEQHGEALVKLLFLDRSSRSLKSGLVADELGRDYCTREGGLTLLGRRSGLDVHGAEDLAEGLAPPGAPPKSAVPFIITIELLLLERAVLEYLYERLSRNTPESVDDLLRLKQEILDALEEYYGAITNATRFSAAVTADGEQLLGLSDLYDAVMGRLETVSFSITTRYQRRMALSEFWLTVVFGATEIGFIASNIAAWHYSTELVAVLAWTVGAAVASALALVLALRRRVQ